MSNETMRSLQDREEKLLAAIKICQEEIYKDVRIISSWTKNKETLWSNPSAVSACTLHIKDLLRQYEEMLLYIDELVTIYRQLKTMQTTSYSEAHKQLIVERSNYLVLIRQLKASLLRRN